MDRETEQPTFGMKAVGLTFNPSGLVSVAVMKQRYADIIDDLNMTRNEATDPEVKRLCAVAITQAQDAQMWAVKALTWESK